MPIVAAAPAVNPLPTGTVRLAHGGVFARARDEMLHLARVYPVDRVLAVFRRNAGLDTRGAQPPGTWEDFGHPQEQPWSETDYPGREHAQTANLLRGHYAGHFLSMLAMAAASTHEPALRAKVDELVAGLAEVQDALAATGRYSHPGFLAAYGEWQFSRLEHYAPYGEIWAPYYTCHKIMAGLLDAYELAGSAQALEVVTRMGHWVHSRLVRLDAGRRQRMWSLYIAGEFGGMNETMARLSVVAAEPVFLDTAAMFDQDALMDAGAARTDILTDMHANQHLPQLLGYLRQYEITGTPRYLDAVTGLWGQLVPGRMYAHGGTGESELWGPPATVAGDIGHRNAETCATYNLVKIARRLFQHTRDARYQDYIERALVNHILGSRRAVRSDVSPEVTYMFPVHPGALREYDNVGTCCGGTGLENHVSYQEAVFAEGDGELWITQLFAASAVWAGLEVTVDSAYPVGGDVRVRFARGAAGAPPDGPAATLARAIHVRIPGWVLGTVDVFVNGEKAATGIPASFVTLDRVWADGDEVRFTLPLPLRAERTIDDPGLQALFLGPTLLLARSEATTAIGAPLWGARRIDGSLTGEALAAGPLRGDAPAAGPLTGDAPAREARAADLGAGVISLGGLEFEPCWSGADSRYHMYLRADDEVIAFAGVLTGVPNRRRPDGSTFLSALWADGAFRDGDALLDRVLEVALAVRAEGLLSRDELENVLVAAGESLARIVPGASPDTANARTVTVTTGERAAWSTAADGTLTWTVPDDETPVAPAVEIVADITAAPSGWYLSSPRVHVQPVDLGDGAELQCSWRLDGGAWNDGAGPVVLDDGIHTIDARVIDAHGAVGSTSREFSVDTAPPVSRARVKSLGASVEITLDASDDVSGVERIQWEGPGTFWGTFQEAFVRALTDTEQVIEFAATDRAGNEEARQRIVLPRRTHA
ncbi:beta-L-arabinofuranosidase domain-containing protein [Microbacterium invictum]|uniref:Glycosyl hydrolase n=1 Tax=Microbacterium invictum TaxID=515415 RepID=A0AA40SPK0_9MICO|nr:MULTISPECIES: beta-L-arabinofuranosidase domain-containing protein [Microbacterium]MBB4139959.1 hypothetical protein [Microbacterium invictum]